MPGPAAAYAGALFAMLLAATAAVTVVLTVRHLDPPEVSAPAQQGHIRAAIESGEMCPRVLTSVALTGVGLLSWFPVRRWYRRWGATDAEMARTMPGDADVPQATYETTLAVTVHACSSNSMRSLLRRLPAWTVRLLVPRYVTVGDV